MFRIFKIDCEKLRERLRVMRLTSLRLASRPGRLDWAIRDLARKIREDRKFLEEADRLDRLKDPKKRQKGVHWKTLEEQIERRIDYEVKASLLGLNKKNDD